MKGDREKTCKIFQKKRKKKRIKTRILNSRIVPKKLKRGPTVLIEYPFRYKIPKKEGETFWRHWKIFQKNSHSTKKIERGTL